MNMEMLTKLCTHLDVCTQAIERSIFLICTGIQLITPDKFNASMLFWHSRHGPGMPPELVKDMQNFLTAVDFPANALDFLS